MNAISQQVTKSAAAKGIAPALGLKTPMRGLAGNHTLIKGPVLQRKCACGGQCETCKKPEDVVQTKLAVSAPGDRYEQEADRVANQVLSAPVHGAIEASLPRIQRFAGHSAGQEAAPKSVDSVLRSQGRPLNPILRQDMQQRFGADFSQVRVHSGAAAERSAREVNAHAYTVGHDIVFGPGRFAPATQQGQRLIAHELTHVVQQSGAAGGAMGRQVQRKVVDDNEHMPCRGKPGRVRLLTSLEQEAAKRADGAAVALRKRPPDEPTHKLVWKWFRRNYNDPIDRCRFIPEIADRFVEIAKAIRTTEATYNCSEEGDPNERCKGHFAFRYPSGPFGSPKFDLCERFWNPDNADQQAPTILHEWVHELYGLEDEQGGFETPECYSVFANYTADLVEEVRVFEDSSKCDPNPQEKAPELDRAKVGASCPLNFSLNVSALGGLAFGLPGSTRFFGGVSGAALIPINKQHEWELAVGAKYLRFAPTDSKDRVPFLWGVSLGVIRRHQHWRPPSTHFGAHIEAGGIGVSGEEGRETRPYVAGRFAGGINLEISKEKAMQILGEAQVGRAFATDTERGFTFFQLGLNLVFQLD